MIGRWDLQRGAHLFFTLTTIHPPLASCSGCEDSESTVETIPRDEIRGFVVRVAQTGRFCEHLSGLDFVFSTSSQRRRH